MKRFLAIIALLAGILMLAYSIYMVCIGKSLAGSGIVFTAIGLLILSLGVFFNVSLSRPKKQPLKLRCIIFGHIWKADCNYNGNDHGNITHTCRRCGLTQAHSWTQVEHQCQEKCTKCGEVKFLPHKFAEKSPCHFVCEVCGKQEVRHAFIKKSDCEKVCSKCGKSEITHQWKTITMPQDGRGVSFWSVGLQKEVMPSELPPKPQGCFCERCLEENPEGFHRCKTRWEKDENGTPFSVTRCLDCGTICEKLTVEEQKKRDREEDMRRYEQAVNEDEGIFR
jgi:hypothetical protein